MIKTIADSPLGRAARYPEAYDPGLLYPVDRSPQREELGIGPADALPFDGVDRWTVWEASWLDTQGRPQVGIVAFSVPCDSPRIVESKSVKLYFASLNHERVADAGAFRALLARDLSAATLADVEVRVDLPPAWPRYARQDPAGTVIDALVPAGHPDAPDAAVLETAVGEADEALLWHAFRSLCPVTGQPDYATMCVRYAGPRIVAASLAAYLAGFRRHPGFHEHCVERIHTDLMRACKPRTLEVEARFTRRGGIDINPLRRSPGSPAASARAPTLRQ